MTILGIHLDFPLIRTCLIRKGRQGIEIHALKTFSLNDDSHPIPQYKTLKTEAIFRSPLSNVKPLYFKGRVASGLSAKDFLIRSMEVKVAGGRHIEETIAFQSEALSHFKPEEVITFPFVEKKEKGKADAVLFTVPRDGIKEHLKKLEELEIDPDTVSTIPSALCHFIRWKFPNLERAFIIDLGSSETTCALLGKGGLKKSHCIPKGVERLLEALHEDRKKILLKKEIEGAAKQIDLLLLKKGLNPRLSEDLNELRQELSKVYYSFTRGSVIPVIFTGRCDGFIHLREFLIDFSEEKCHLTHEEQKFSISMGLALEQVSPRPLQLRLGEFFPKKNWARMGSIALLLLATSIFLSATLLGIEMQAASLKKQQMLDSLQTASRKKLLTEGPAEEQIGQWIDAIETNNKEYPYILQAPKVSAFLSWLSSHPLLEELKLEGDPIDVRQIKYQLTSFPTIRSDTEPFLAKVEIEFDFKNAMNARKFHEALRERTDWIDPKLEIGWEALNDGYRASFFMKTQGPYVP